MKISTEIGSIADRVGEEKAIEYVAKAGFDAWDYTLLDLAYFDFKTRKFISRNNPVETQGIKYVKHLKQVGLDNGIICNQSHAPFPTHFKEAQDKLKLAIEYTAEAGGKICIIHPQNDKNAEENAQTYFELLPFAKGCGVKIALENMWNWKDNDTHASKAACSHHLDFLAHLNKINDDYAVACLDLGHAEMAGLDTSAVEMIHTLGDKLQALHIHDNDKVHDEHLLPFTRSINYPPIIKALKDINYQGYFTLECLFFLTHYDGDTFSGVKILHDTAKKLADMYESF